MRSEPAGPPPAQINANRKSAKQQWGAVRGALQSMRVMKAATKASATVAGKVNTLYLYLALTGEMTGDIRPSIRNTHGLVIHKCTTSTVLELIIIQPV